MSQVCSQCGHISTQQEIADCAGGFIEGKHYCDKCFQQALYRKSQPPPMLIAQSKSKWPIWVSSVGILVVFAVVFLLVLNSNRSSSRGSVASSISPIITNPIATASDEPLHSPMQLTSNLKTSNLISTAQSAISNAIKNKGKYYNISVRADSQSMAVTPVSSINPALYLLTGRASAYDRKDNPVTMKYVSFFSESIPMSFRVEAIGLYDWIPEDIDDPLLLWLRLELNYETISWAVWRDVSNWSINGKILCKLTDSTGFNFIENITNWVAFNPDKQFFAYYSVSFTNKFGAPEEKVIKAKVAFSKSEIKWSVRRFE